MIDTLEAGQELNKLAGGPVLLPDEALEEVSTDHKRLAEPRR